MIHVELQPEPAPFDRLVRQPGHRFLARHVRPTKNLWRSHDYWVRVKGELYAGYNQICAYSSHWIPPDTGSRTCEHFVPKDRHPKLAYEWSNYRLVCGTLNGRKGTRGVLDPFELKDGWFVIDFPSLLVRPGRSFDLGIARRIQETIDVLGLNDEGTCLMARASWTRDYCCLVREAQAAVAFEFLKRRAPFLAVELQRQGLIESIVAMMG